MVNDLLPLAGVDLPLYVGRKDAYSLFYTPGCVRVFSHADTPAIEAALISQQVDLLEPPVRDGVWALLRGAYDALNSYTQLCQHAYQPECLTLYLSERCNLACAYCFADSTPADGPLLGLEAVIHGAQTVAAVCARKGLPFTLVVHGGGEPVCHPELLENILIAVEEIADSTGLPLFRYIATNGVYPADRARWLASSFDLIGLSVDGPPEIQDSQRPLAGGGGTTALVERTAAVFNEEGTRYMARVTITPATMNRQREIVRYLCEVIQPESIAFEPTYSGGRASEGQLFAVEDAPLFLDSFLKAQAAADDYGIPLTLSGTREGEIHQAYCHLFRDVLNLTPDGGITACFKSTGGTGDFAQRARIGHVGGFVEIDRGRIDALRGTLSAIPSGCASCFNRFTCVKSCPDKCLLDVNDPASETPFRCALLKGLAYHRIEVEAEAQWLKEGNPDAHV